MEARRALTHADHATDLSSSGGGRSATGSSASTLTPGHDCAGTSPWIAHPRLGPSTRSQAVATKATTGFPEAPPSLVDPGAIDLGELRKHVRTLATVGASEALMVSCYLSVEPGLTRRDVIERRLRSIRATLPTSQRGELDGSVPQGKARPARAVDVGERPHALDPQEIRASPRGSATDSRIVCAPSSSISSPPRRVPIMATSCRLRSRASSSTSNRSRSMQRTRSAVRSAAARWPRSGRCPRSKLSGGDRPTCS